MDNLTRPVLDRGSIPATTSITFTEKKCFHPTGDTARALQEQDVAEILTGFLGLIGFSKCTFIGNHSGYVRCELTEEEKASLDKGRFYVYHWTRESKLEEDDVQNLASYKYKNKSIYHSIYKPSGLGIPVSHDGVTYAEYFPELNRVLILFDAIHVINEKGQTKRLFDELMTDIAIAIIESKGKNADEIKAMIAAKELEERKQRFVEKSKKIVSNIARDLKVRLEDTVARIEDYKQALTRYTREELRYRKEYEDATARESTFLDKMLGEFNKVLDIDGIKSFDIDNDCYVFTTDMLYFHHDGHRFKAGEYAITCHIIKSDIRYTNLTPENRRKSCWGDRCQHPHVSEEGKPCLGNAAEMIAVLNANNEVAALATVLKSFLESINIEDPAGKYYHNWDCVDENGNKIPYKHKSKNHDEAECESCGHEGYVGEDIHNCNDCGEHVCESCSDVIDDNWICNSCRDDNYTYVSCCDDYILNDDVHICEQCGAATCEDHVIEEFETTFCCGACKNKYEEEHWDEIHEDDEIEDEDEDDDEIEDFDEIEEATEVVSPNPMFGIAPIEPAVVEYSEADAAATRVVMDELATALGVPALEIPPAPSTPALIACTQCMTRIVPETELFTCEVCGTQGCSNCIRIDDSGIYTCEEHR